MALSLSVGAPLLLSAPSPLPQLKCHVFIKGSKNDICNKNFEVNKSLLNKKKTAYDKNSANTWRKECLFISKPGFFITKVGINIRWSFRLILQVLSRGTLKRKTTISNKKINLYRLVFSKMAGIVRMDKHQRGFCWWCIRTVKWIPVLFIFSIILWSYYVYLIPLCYHTIDSYVQKVFYLIFFHFFFVLFTWSYWKTIHTDLMNVPEKFRLSAVEMEAMMNAEGEEIHKQIIERFASNLPVATRTLKGEIRYCDICVIIKPDRTHHCSVCGRCILKMDHHCPWVNNCVGFHNYKYFILFLAYALLYCLYISATTLEYFILFWKGELDRPGKFHIFFLFFVALMFAISLNSLFFYHCYLVLHNRSTLEAFRPPIFRTGKDKDGFSLGKYNNFQEVFGDNRKLWFLPVFTSLGNGVDFPVRNQHQGASNTYNSMGSTESRFENIVNIAEAV